MAQIGKDYYEDLTPERLGEIIDALRAGEVPVPGSQAGRYASEPAGGATTLTAHVDGRPEHNASVERALAQGDTVKRIDGTEDALTAPWGDQGGRAQG
jgi:NADH-quinone oxidoreductase subunit E